MSETPLTDAQVAAENPVGEPGNTALITTAFARMLEGEVTSLRKELAEVTAAFQAECSHDWERCDDSFSHEFGTEIIRYLRCEKCGKHAELDDIPHIDDDGPDPDVQRDRLRDNP